jgi:hypothetical protein
MGKNPKYKAVDLSKLGEKPRVHIGIGCQENVKAKTLGSIMGVLITSPSVVTGYSMRQGGDIVSARTFCVQDAIEKKATHIFFVDSDMQFPPDTLEKLLAHKKEIVTVEYNRRKLPAESVTTPQSERSEKELYKAHNIGGGCLLIDLKVFEQIAKPWFNFGRNSNGELVIGEDTWFANTARDAGIDSWIDPTIPVKHIGEYLY